jgi:hypothetical protein
MIEMHFFQITKIPLSNSIIPNTKTSKSHSKNQLLSKLPLFYSNQHNIKAKRPFQICSDPKRRRRAPPNPDILSPPHFDPFAPPLGFLCAFAPLRPNLVSKSFPAFFGSHVKITEGGRSFLWFFLCLL